MTQQRRSPPTRVVRERYPLLAQALLAGASGQLRNLATVGGNLLQRTRCAYFQDVTKPCNKRGPGSGCPAREGDHRNLADPRRTRGTASPRTRRTWRSRWPRSTRRCSVAGPAASATIPMPGLHRLPGDEPERDTVLEPGELIVAVELPALPMAARSALPQGPRPRVVRVRGRLGRGRGRRSTDGAVRDCRIAFGGVAHVPWRAERAEEALRGARGDRGGVPRAPPTPSSRPPSRCATTPSRCRWRATCSSRRSREVSGDDRSRPARARSARRSRGSTAREKVTGQRPLRLRAPRRGRRPTAARCRRRSPAGEVARRRRRRGARARRGARRHLGRTTRPRWPTPATPSWRCPAVARRSPTAGRSSPRSWPRRSRSRARRPGSCASPTTSSRTTSILRADHPELYAPEKVNPAFPTETAAGRRRRRARRGRGVRRRDLHDARVPQQPDGAARDASRSGSDGGADALRLDAGRARARRRRSPKLFGLEPEQVRVISPHVGGGFGSKGTAAPERRARRDGREGRRARR